MPHQVRGKSKTNCGMNIRSEYIFKIILFTEVVIDEFIHLILKPIWKCKSYLNLYIWWKMLLIVFIFIIEINFTLISETFLDPNPSIE